MKETLGFFKTGNILGEIESYWSPLGARVLSFDPYPSSASITVQVMRKIVNKLTGVTSTWIENIGQVYGDITVPSTTFNLIPGDIIQVIYNKAGNTFAGRIWVERDP